MTQKLTLPIQVGKKYVRRDGIVVTAQMGASAFDSKCIYVGTGHRSQTIGIDHVWEATGRVDYHRQPHPHDLVADFVEKSPKKPKKPAAKQSVKETKMYTLEQFLQAIKKATGYNFSNESTNIQEQLDKLDDPEYIEYLRLKQKFEN